MGRGREVACANLHCLNAEFRNFIKRLFKLQVHQSIGKYAQFHNQFSRNE